MKKKNFIFHFFKYEIIKFIHIVLISYLAFEIYNLIQWNFNYFTNENTSSNLINIFNIKLIDGINTQLLHYRESLFLFFQK